MQGKIKAFIHDKGFGFIEVDGQSEDVFFHITTVKDSSVRCAVGEIVDFDAAESKRKPGTLEARNVRLAAGYEHEEFRLTGHPSSYLLQWGFTQLDDLDPRGNSVRGVLHDLAEIALDEDWAYGDNHNPRTPFPILRNYLINTFYKQYRDGQVAEVAHGGKSWAAFNTGLVDDRYDPIFALYEQNDRPPRPWKFHAFCRPNIGREGQTLARNFNPLPPAPKYFDKAEDVIFDPDTAIQPRYDHIVYDSIEKDRYPSDFLEKHIPSGIEWKDPSKMEKPERAAFLREFRHALVADARTDRDIRNRIDDAISLAVKRARWNFKTAIPLYYPKANAISLLLPIALVDDDKVDLALVVTRTAAGGYSGETVYKLKWAYDHARLVCRPDSDWLTPSAGDGTEEDDEISEEPSVPDAVLPTPVRTEEATSVEVPKNSGPWNSTIQSPPETETTEPAKKEGILSSLFGRRS
ncbi:hypothetical protein MED193_18819 [Roseobacter sp. MED193]|jgi:cold shock CspA family protein|uniref:DUF3825 domain-containing protein n=1 Tax=Roseobacter sp. MED193 TaxID=314262 RepID=UPI000068B729|nr:DUF3825 domain-containing protein [Roseobacter sp. MED193]EAQ47275.1 hypothetical protein MED193_18819 [Roseobacter sp. MED193]